jgi:hypothetical protein
MTSKKTQKTVLENKINLKLKFNTNLNIFFSQTLKVKKHT